MRDAQRRMDVLALVPTLDIHVLASKLKHTGTSTDRVFVFFNVPIIRSSKQGAGRRWHYYKHVKKKWLPSEPS